MLQSLMGLKLVKDAGKRSEDATAKTKTSIIKRDGRREPKGVSYARNADIKPKTKSGKPISIMSYIRTQK